MSYSFSPIQPFYFDVDYKGDSTGGSGTSRPTKIFSQATGETDAGFQWGWRTDGAFLEAFKQMWTNRYLNQEDRLPSEPYPEGFNPDSFSPKYADPINAYYRGRESHPDGYKGWGPGFQLRKPTNQLPVDVEKYAGKWFYDLTHHMDPYRNPGFENPSDNPSDSIGYSGRTNYWERIQESQFRLDRVIDRKTRSTRLVYTPIGAGSGVEEEEETYTPINFSEDSNNENFSEDEESFLPIGRDFGTTLPQLLGSQDTDSRTVIFALKLLNSILGLRSAWGQTFFWGPWSASNPSNLGAEALFDLGQETDFGVAGTSGRMDIQFAQTEDPFYRYQIYTSLDGVTWNLGADQSTRYSRASLDSVPLTGKARYVKFVDLFSSDTAGEMKVSEMALYDPAGNKLSFAKVEGGVYPFYLVDGLTASTDPYATFHWAPLPTDPVKESAMTLDSFWGKIFKEDGTDETENPGSYDRLAGYFGVPSVPLSDVTPFRLFAAYHLFSSMGSLMDELGSFIRRSAPEGGAMWGTPLAQVEGAGPLLVLNQKDQNKGNQISAVQNLDSFQKILYTSIRDIISRLNQTDPASRKVIEELGLISGLFNIDASLPWSGVDDYGTEQVTVTVPGYSPYHLPFGETATISTGEAYRAYRTADNRIVMTPPSFLSPVGSDNMANPFEWFSMMFGELNSKDLKNPADWGYTSDNFKSGFDVSFWLNGELTTLHKPGAYALLTAEGLDPSEADAYTFEDFKTFWKEHKIDEKQGPYSTTTTYGTSFVDDSLPWRFVHLFNLKSKTEFLEDKKWNIDSDLLWDAKEIARVMGIILLNDMSRRDFEKKKTDYEKDKREQEEEDQRISGKIEAKAKESRQLALKIGAEARARSREAFESGERQRTNREGQLVKALKEK